MTDADAPGADDPPWMHTLYALFHAFDQERDQ